MTVKTIKKATLALILTSALPFAACGKDNNSTTPTSPTQPGPTVTTTTPPPITDDTVSVSGVVSALNRYGAGDLSIQFRLDNFTVVRAASGTPVMSGGQTFNTDAVRNGQTVTVQGKRTSGEFLDASSITITAQAP